tara:strand:+ start:181 stop:810 length:630 start_codon:yes stop_codon:yes gene_type:complete
MSVAIIDYKAGNLRNVQKSIEKFDVRADIISDGSDLVNYDAIILPGVGSYFHGIRNLTNANFKDTLRKQVLVEKKPLLGICLGMQLMGSYGTEGGESYGLDLIPFKVKKLDSKKLRLPHIGWNDLIKIRDSKILDNIPDKSDFYFVHSYCVSDIDEKYICGKSLYGNSFPALIENENIFGAQFHPEKSQKYGLQIIRNFLEYSKKYQKC